MHLPIKFEDTLSMAYVPAVNMRAFAFSEKLTDLEIDPTLTPDGINFPKTKCQKILQQIMTEGLEGIINS